MARVIICDICAVTYTEVSHDQNVEYVELNGKSLRFYLDIDNGEDPGYSRLDVCTACRKQVLRAVLEQGE